MVGAPWLNEDMTQLFYACANSQAGDTEGAEAASLSHLASSTTEVRVVQVVRGDFELELIRNGKLEAQRRAVVPFAVQEQILSVSVRHHCQSACQGFQSIFSLCLLSEILDVDAMHLVFHVLETEMAQAQSESWTNCTNCYAQGYYCHGVWTYKCLLGGTTCNVSGQMPC